MTKKHFIDLADRIREENRYGANEFNAQHLRILANFCKSQNANFKEDRWLGYISGINGKNGGKVSKGIRRALFKRRYANRSTR